jgi:CDP-L-myo-inositol myo-inositolphosphotransferase
MNSLRNCLILAAGAGSRLNGVGVPKPLVPVLGVPLIERVILTASRAGLIDFTVITGHEGERIEKFLDHLAVRRGLQISCVRNDEWREGNGLSVLRARDELKRPFVLLMADHLIEERLLVSLTSEPLEEGTVRLAVDRDLRNPLVDLADATKVQSQGDRLRQIGKHLENYNSFDTGCFACTPALFDALEHVHQEPGDLTLSAGIQRLAAAGRVHTAEVDGAFWVDVDDPQAAKRAERALLRRLGKPSDGPISRHLNRPLSTRISRHLVGLPITPNQISLFCFALSVVAAGLFAVGGTLGLAVGALLAQFASVVDGCDGEVARLRFEESSTGGWFDAVLDRYADAFLLFGLTWHAYGVHAASWVWVVGFLAIIGSFMNSYTADKHDQLMKVRFSRGRRIRIGRDVRVFMIFVGALCNLPLLTLGLIGGLMNLETVRRVVVATSDE